jgi:hypothetical protein
MVYQQPTIEGVYHKEEASCALQPPNIAHLTWPMTGDRIGMSPQDICHSCMAGSRASCPVLAASSARAFSMWTLSFTAMLRLVWCSLQKGHTTGSTFLHSGQQAGSTALSMWTLSFTAMLRLERCSLYKAVHQAEQTVQAVKSAGSKAGSSTVAVQYSRQRAQQTGSTVAIQYIQCCSTAGRQYSIQHCSTHGAP